MIATALSLGACAANVPETRTPDALLAERDAAEREQRRAHLMRERELRAQLALARARATELEARIPTDTVTIGGGDGETSFFHEDDDEGWDEPSGSLPPRRVRAPEDTGPRPVLRLYGLPPAPELPAAPVGLTPYVPVGATPPAPAPSVVPSNDRLPWQSSTPSVAAPVPAPTPSRVQAPQRIDLGAEAYRSALGLLRSRNFSEAQVAFERFLDAHPNHPRAPSAHYWRAESLYIQRSYGAARVAFDAYLRRFPSGARVPAAMLKLAYCHRRLGDEAEAQRHLQALTRRFPSSEAARLAARPSETR